VRVGTIGIVLACQVDAGEDASRFEIPGSRFRQHAGIE